MYFNSYHERSVGEYTVRVCNHQWGGYSIVLYKLFSNSPLYQDYAKDNATLEAKLLKIKEQYANTPAISIGNIMDKVFKDTKCQS